MTDPAHDRFVLTVVCVTGVLVSGMFFLLLYALDSGGGFCG